MIASRDGQIWAAVRTSELRREQSLQEIRVHGPGGIRILRPSNGPANARPSPRAADSRHLAVLGEENLARLRRLHIAVIGIGGVGSMVTRLVGSLVARLILIDPDKLEPHNAPRLWYAGASSRGAKVIVAQRALQRAFPDLKVTARVAAFPSPETIALIRQADFVFVCPDHHAVRDAASRTASAEMLPLIEVGCGGRKEERKLSSLGYHVRLQIPGGPCLACNGLDTSRLEDPETTRAKRSSGYIEDGEEVAGELGCLTARAASDAVDVMLRYWTGYVGAPPIHLYVDALHLKSLDLSHSFGVRADCPTCGAASLKCSKQDPMKILRPLAQRSALKRALTPNAPSCTIG